MACFVVSCGVGDPRGDCGVVGVGFLVFGEGSSDRDVVRGFVNGGRDN